MTAVLHVVCDGLEAIGYEQLMATVGRALGNDDGPQAHIASQTHAGIEIVEVWATPSRAVDFVERRLVPALGEQGLAGARYRVSHALDVLPPLCIGSDSVVAVGALPA